VVVVVSLEMLFSREVFRIESLPAFLRLDQGSIHVELTGLGLESGRINFMTVCRHWMS